MSAKKPDMSAHEPSWAEVIFGAVLSVVLGVALGIFVLAIKPLAGVRELPKEPVAGAVYYVVGSRESSKAKQAPAKRKAFAQGASVNVTEDEVNSFLAAPPAPVPAPGSKPKAGEKAKAPAAAKAPAPAPAKAPVKAGEKAAPVPANGEMLAVGEPNFRFRDGGVQITVPVTVNVFGLEQALTVLAKGAFVKQGAAFKFEAETLYLGSCPVQRVPFLNGFVAGKFLTSQPVPEDIAAAWAKVTSVAVDGSVLKLTMP